MIDNHQERSDKPNSIQSWEVYLFDHANFESPIYLNSFKKETSSCFISLNCWQNYKPATSFPSL
jgi:hypothetical protein